MAVENHDALATEAERNISIPECATKIRTILLTTESNSNKFSTMKHKIQKIHQECELAPAPLQEPDKLINNAKGV